MSQDFIRVRGARQHNLKNIDLDIPKNKLVVFTGLSGSGKSSLAFDTLYAEGQRRYVESLSSYARQFLGVMDKPDVDSIEGLSPAIAINQKSISHNPRSTVGTITEVYDYLRLLFARIGHPHCPQCGREISRQSAEQIANTILEKKGRFLLLAPVIKDRKGSFEELFRNIKTQGFSRVRVDGQMHAVDEDFSLIRTNKHTIEVEIDRFSLAGKIQPPRLNRGRFDNVNKVQPPRLYADPRGERVQKAVELGLDLGNGVIVLAEVKDKAFEIPEYPKNLEDTVLSEHFACPVCLISITQPEPRGFSFNSPHGACPICEGLGTKQRIDPKLLYNPKLTVLEGGIYPWSNIGDEDTWTGNKVRAVAAEHNIPLNVPVESLNKDKLDILLYGTPGKTYTIHYADSYGTPHTHQSHFEGLIPNLERRYKETNSDYMRTEIEKFMVKEFCEACQGTRLKNEALGVTIKGINIAAVADLPIEELREWALALSSFHEGKKESQIAKPIIKEALARLDFMLAVGLNYLTLSRTSASLAGGESQRIRLASQIGSGLSGIMYVLDEPSIGLHQRDQARLIATLKKLRDLGNTVIVVEHDAQTMLESDYIFDIGPGVGERGGKIVAVGTPEEIMQNKASLTGQYLSGKRKINIEKNGMGGVDQSPASSDVLQIVGCRQNNLKSIDVSIPLGKLTVVVGVSGSGKSTLVNETLYRALRYEFGLKNEERPGEHDGLLGVENIDKVIAIDQSPIGRTPRSNPATYTKTFDHIRDLFALTKEAKIKGFKKGRFSFNVKGGRCEVCEGEGEIKIEMQFLSDLYVKCEACGGKRYNSETLSVYYNNKNIAEVLDMTVEEALAFFNNHPNIRRNLETLTDVGLNYIKLGQPATTLSGGEAQRVKLSLELSKRQTGKTFYILDEPTTGLHFADLEKLLKVLRLLVNKGNTVLVVEHNLDVVKSADWIVELGPEGGEKGGRVIFVGELAQMLKSESSPTGRELRKQSLRR